MRDLWLLGARLQQPEHSHSLTHLALHLPEHHPHPPTHPPASLQASALSFHLAQLLLTADPSYATQSHDKRVSRPAVRSVSELA